MSKTVAIIGGGAAGFFCAVNLARLKPDYKVIIFEKSSKLLAKVRVSGGGRCNVTHACFDNNLLVKNYPRGEKQLKSVFSRFTTTDTVNWYEERGIALKTEMDGRMFPESDSSETIISCLMNEAERYGVRINTNTELLNIKKEEQLNLSFKTTTEPSSVYEQSFDAVIIACGGFPKKEAYRFLGDTGHRIKDPVPSLFTINLPGDPVIKLMGVSVPLTQVKIAASGYTYSGPVLITHWGLSGPAVLKLSAFAAEYFHEKNYGAKVLVNWTNKNEEEVRADLMEYISINGRSQSFTQNLYPIPKRLWEFLLFRAEIPVTKPWAEVSKKCLNKLISLLTADEHNMQGKTTFKEEFVTCGGVALEEVDFKTMESRLCKGLYFAGEILNIDGITGGFNFQAAWSTAWIAANAV
jgi:predicted Rossmann fold flavoprotein